MTHTAPLALGFDTSGPYCAAALQQGEIVIDARTEAMTRGQAERLMPMLQEMLTQAGFGWQDLTVLGVGTGPGNFTGIRVAVSAARGLALGLGIPAVGVTGFAARGRVAGHDAVAIPAPRNQVYIADPTPRLVPAASARNRQDRFAHTDLATAIAHIAFEQRNRTTSPPPTPFYLRTPGAAPAKDAPPIILD
ncbi:MAG: tRNA (adenosine(37)-N6)-threonylcarbamoyltransferase complex dimerization subunit type 1 TsaB [Rhodobacteraceae bacterium]|nr:tRNA (adenosine(37)-N6)-threonylcarbamoyltransferase complex dimerization subunit type 1 TsaB [Paracoccaceae bacterium]